jgi:two-component system chemotaxis response regulator CheB
MLNKIVAIGASAGGVEASRQLISLLPPEFPAAVVVAIHIPASCRSYLPEIFTRSGPLPAMQAQNDAPLKPGNIYVAPPDFHLTVGNNSTHLFKGPKENSSRPSIDTLFRSVASSYRIRATAILLSGTLDDGTAGMLSIKLKGGTTVVQDPNEAIFSDMPRNALTYVDIDYCLPINDIAALLTRNIGGSLNIQRRACG